MNPLVSRAAVSEIRPSQGDRHEFCVAHGTGGTSYGVVSAWNSIIGLMVGVAITRGLLSADAVP